MVFSLSLLILTFYEKHLYGKRYEKSFTYEIESRMPLKRLKHYSQLRHGNYKLIKEQNSTRNKLPFFVSTGVNNRDKKLINSYQQRNLTLELLTTKSFDRRKYTSDSSKSSLKSIHRNVTTLFGKRYADTSFQRDDLLATFSNSMEFDENNEIHNKSRSKNRGIVNFKPNPNQKNLQKLDNIENNNESTENNENPDGAVDIEEASIVSKDPPISLSQHQIKPSLYESYVIRPEVCRNRTVTLAVCVVIKRSNTEGRKTIRETWGSPGTSRTGPVVLMFFLGSAKSDEDPKVQEQIFLESKTNADIIQGGYIDDYHNLTLKSLQIIHWYSVYCKRAKYILKADDDMYVNLALLVNNLDLKSQDLKNKPFILGRVIDHAMPIRNTSDKWYTSWEEYPDVYFPRYENGGCGYAMTGSAAWSIRQAARHVTFLKMEDVYITGSCAKRANISVEHDRKFSKKHLNQHPKYMYYQISAGDYFNYHEFYQIHESFMELSPLHKHWVRKRGMVDVYQNILNVNISASN